MRTPTEPSPTIDDSPRSSGRRAIWPAIAVALSTAVLVHVLLATTSGIDTQPPECYSYFGYVVPCSSGLWVGLALAAGAVAGAVVYAVRRRRK